MSSQTRPSETSAATAPAPGLVASLDERLTDLLASKPDAIASPFALYQDLLAHAPVHRWGPTVVVTRLEDIKKIVRDEVRFSNRAHAIGSRATLIRSGLSPEHQRIFDEVTAFEELMVNRADGEQHARLRNIIHRAFTPRNVAKLGERTSELTDQLMDEMVASGETDITSAITKDLPVMLICALLNVPLEDRHLIQDLSAKIGKNRGGAVTQDLLAAHTALREFRAYADAIIEQHRLHPESTNLVSTLMGASDEERLTGDELVAMVVILLFAGADTTKVLMGNGTFTLLTNRGQWEALRADPEGLVGGAVDELIRFISPVQMVWRVTTEAVEIGGLDVAEGTTVMLLLGAANRDPAHFSDPDRFDIRRTESRQHIAFGFGAHFCLGTSLARMEASTFFVKLARRFPDLELAQPAESVTFGGNIQFRAVTALQVDLGVERSPSATSV